ncbi:peroxide stress protein YaaA [Phascolarctobacterium faecium]|nr:peroxide stress protein YaaA [Phascolarctobacterium faecium]MDM8109181.1 peroxide stress protein YaaA [Phascolarctobacterium faecium]
MYDELVKNDSEVLNLASKEYSKAVEPYIAGGVRFVTCVFGSLQNGKIKIKATEAKMARGEMVRRCAENNVQHIDDVKNFTVNGYSFEADLSTDTEFVFLK